MAQKEINAFLANTKVYVNGKSREIQEKLFSFGYEWCSGVEEVCHTDMPFLFIYENKSFTSSNDMERFSNHENREITAEEIIALELSGPDYRPFKDKNECWNTMLQHEPFGWLKSRHAYLHAYYSVSSVGDAYIWINDKASFTFEEAVNKLNFVDGEPFGIKEEE